MTRPRLGLVGTAVAVLAMLRLAQATVTMDERGRARRAENPASQHDHVPQPELTSAPRSIADWASQRDTLLAVVTHDMLNTLAGLDGYLELLDEEPTSARGRELQGRLRRLTDRLSLLSADLLLDTTAGLEKVVVASTPLVVADELHTCALGFPDLEIHVDVDEPHRPGICSADATGAEPAAPALLVRADPLRLQQVLGNLVRNAERYGRPPIILIARRAQASGGEDWVDIVVSDDGDGVPAEFVDHLFEPYRRGPNAPSSSSADPSRIGVGLGLPLAPPPDRTPRWDPDLRSSHTPLHDQPPSG